MGIDDDIYIDDERPLCTICEQGCPPECQGTCPVCECGCYMRFEVSMEPAPYKYQPIRMR